MPDTIPDPDLLEPDDVTGPFQTERAKRRAALERQRSELVELVEERSSAIEARETSRSRKLIVAVIAAVLTTGAGGLGTSIVTSSQSEARIEERATALDHRVASLESQLDGIGQLQREVASMRATMETWRSMDASAREASAREVDRRLARIESLLERRR